MSKIFRPEWRTHNRAKRRFYARYMGWLERGGFLVTLILIGSFAASFFWQTEEWLTADEVPIEASKVEGAGFVATSPLYLEELLVKNGDDVREGQALAKVYLGENAAYLQSQLLLDRAINSTQNATERQKLLLARNSIPLPQATTFQAKASGSVRLANDLKLGWKDEGTEILSIVDYSRLFVQAKLAGKSIAQAAAGQPAKLSQLKFNSPSQTVLRGPLGSGVFLSRSVVSDSAKSELEAKLKGKNVVAPQDAPLAIEGIDSVEVDGPLTGGSNQTKSEPLPEFALDGTVLGGKHLLTAQAGSLPKDVVADVRRLLEKDLEASGLSFEGDPQIIVKLKAGGMPGQGEGIPVASLSRAFEAEIALKDVPMEIVEKIKESHRRSMTATAKVQIRTGTRSLASLLLRRS